MPRDLEITAPISGVFRPQPPPSFHGTEIDWIERGDVLGHIEDDDIRIPIEAGATGILTGLASPGALITRHQVIGRIRLCRAAPVQVAASPH